MGTQPMKDIAPLTYQSTRMSAVRKRLLRLPTRCGIVCYGLVDPSSDWAPVPSGGRRLFLQVLCIFKA
jgi:hypothetical protein